MKENKITVITFSVVFAVIIVVLLLLMPIENERKFKEKWGVLAELSQTDERVRFITENEELYPQELIKYYKGNRTENSLDFLYNYPFHKDDYADMAYTSEELNSDTVPALYMYDNRWRYEKACGSYIQTEGCAAVCLTMAYLYLKDGGMDPVKAGILAEKNDAIGYFGGIIDERIANIIEDMGMTSIPYQFYESGSRKKTADADIELIRQILDSGHVCMAGMVGDSFGSHAVIITSLDGNTMKINDPASEENTSRSWQFDDIKEEIYFIWDIFTE